MSKKIYLTIDDAPSKYTREKIDFLKSSSIPAVFYCRGDRIRKHQDALVYAIQQGFLLGNHSFSHPYFSQISFESCREEILKTEELIEACYQAAEKPRPCKIIRFPFGDPGSEIHRERIQDFLKQQGFISLLFEGIEDPWPTDRIDAVWTWDTLDCKRDMIANSEAYELALKDYESKSQRACEVILMHDLGVNSKLFDITLGFFLEKKFEFLEAEFKVNSRKERCVKF